MITVEIQWLRWIQNIFGVLETTASVLTELGGDIVLLAIIVVVYFAIDKIKGERLAVTLLTSGCVNDLIKTCVMRPRPFVYDDTLSTSALRKKYAGTYSFPSGHAQNSGAIYMSLMMLFRHAWVKVVCIIIMVLVPLTRLILGVHFPSDVAVGLATGVAIAVGMHFLLNKIWDKRDMFYLIFASICVLLVFAVYLPLSFFVDVAFTGKIYGVTSAFLFGLVIEHKWIKMSSVVKLSHRFVRALLALGTLGVLYLFLELIFSAWESHFTLDFLMYFVIVGVTMGVIPLVVKKLKI